MILGTFLRSTHVTPEKVRHLYADDRVISMASEPLRMAGLPDGSFATVIRTVESGITISAVLTEQVNTELGLLMSGHEIRLLRSRRYVLGDITKALAEAGWTNLSQSVALNGTHGLLVVERCIRPRFID